MSNIYEEYARQIHPQLVNLGIDKVLADEANGFESIVGKDPFKRSIVSIWLRLQLQRRDKTETLLRSDLMVFRYYVLEMLAEATADRSDAFISINDLAERMGVL